MLQSLVMSLCIRKWEESSMKTSKKSFRVEKYTNSVLKHFLTAQTSNGRKTNRTIKIATRPESSIWCRE